MSEPTVIGIDFDNTIVCYDLLFHRVCLERGWIPPGTPANKADIRNHLRRAGREDDWTELQGYVYGPRLNEAEPFPGVLSFLRLCRPRNLKVHIISHKTPHPYRGIAYDLHAAAWGWIEAHGIVDPGRIGLHRDQIHFELTKEAKLDRIRDCGCRHFIDDLPEFLAEPGFPEGVTRLLFDPNNLHSTTPYSRFIRWEEAVRLLA